MTTFKTYLANKDFSTQSIISYLQVVNHYKNWIQQKGVPIEKSTYNDVLAYLQYLQLRGVVQRTQQLHITRLKHYFNWCTSVHKRADNPVLAIAIKGIKRKTLYTIFSFTELETLYMNYQEIGGTSLAGKRNNAILGLLVYQGLTTTEITRLTLKDIQLAKGTIYIGATRKSNERTLKLVGHQVLELLEYKEKIRSSILLKTTKTTDLLFVSEGNSLELKGVVRVLITQLRKHYPKLKNLYQLRASVITNWLKHYNLREVQYMAGHRYISSTEAYLINDLEGLHESITTYHPITKSI